MKRMGWKLIVLLLLFALLLSGCKGKETEREGPIVRPTFPIFREKEDPPGEGEEPEEGVRYEARRQGFSFLHDETASVDWNDETGATLYLGKQGDFPYIQIFRGIGEQETFDKDSYFPQLVEWLSQEYGDHFVSSVLYEQYELGSKRFEGGASIQYHWDGRIVQMLVLTEETPHSIVQYICRYYPDQEKETLNALKKLTASLREVNNNPGMLNEGGQGQGPGQEGGQGQPGGEGGGQARHNLRLVPYDGGYFSLMLPEGWQFYIMGEYTTFGFRAWDPANPDYEIFYYGTIDPLNRSQAGKKTLQDYVGFYGLPDAAVYADAPVVDIYSASSLFYVFKDLQALSDKYQMGFSFPLLRGFAPLQSIPVQTIFSPALTDETLLFAGVTGTNGGDCRGKFYSSIANSAPLFGGDMEACPAHALNVTGVIAPKGAFVDVEAVLTEAVSSLRFSDRYIQEGTDYNRRVGGAAMADNAARWAVFDACLDQWHRYFRGE